MGETGQLGELLSFIPDDAQLSDDALEEVKTRPSPMAMLQSREIGRCHAHCLRQILL